MKSFILQWLDRYICPAHQHDIKWCDDCHELIEESEG